MEEQTDFQREMNEMLGGVEYGLRQEAACTQAISANAALALMSTQNFSALTDGDRLVFAYNVFRMSCYALGSMPAVLKSIAAAHGASQEHALVAVVRTLSVLFKFDSVSQVEAMLGGAATEAEPRTAAAAVKAEAGLSCSGRGQEPQCQKS